MPTPTLEFGPLGGSMETPQYMPDGALGETLVGKPTDFQISVELTDGEVVTFMGDFQYGDTTNYPFTSGVITSITDVNAQGTLIYSFQNLNFSVSSYLSYANPNNNWLGFEQAALGSNGTVIGTGTGNDSFLGFPSSLSYVGGGGTNTLDYSVLNNSGDTFFVDSATGTITQENINDNAIFTATFRTIQIFDYPQAGLERFITGPGNAVINFGSSTSADTGIAAVGIGPSPNGSVILDLQTNTLIDNGFGGTDSFTGAGSSLLYDLGGDAAVFYPFSVGAASSTVIIGSADSNSHSVESVGPNLTLDYSEATGPITVITIQAVEVSNPVATFQIGNGSGGTDSVALENNAQIIGSPYGTTLDLTAFQGEAPNQLGSPYSYAFLGLGESNTNNVTLNFALSAGVSVTPHINGPTIISAPSLGVTDIFFNVGTVDFTNQSLFLGLETSITAESNTGATLVTTGQTVTVTVGFAQVVTVTGSPTLQLNDNEVATYRSGSGTDSLTFAYTVKAADDTSDLQVTGLNVTTGTSIRDSSGAALSSVVGDLDLQINTPNYTFTSLSGPVSNGGAFGGSSGPVVDSTTANSINDLSEIIGTQVTGNSQIATAWLYDGGASYTDIGPQLPSNQQGGTWATGINNAGEIVGYTGPEGVPNPFAPPLQFEGFLDNGGVYTTINDPAATSGTYATGINNENQVIGYYYIGSSAYSFLYNSSTTQYTTLPGDSLATGGTFANGINDSGEIVGYYVSGTGNHGFLYNNGTYQTLDDPLATEGTVATGINNSGEVVGYYNNSAGTYGFLYNSGTGTYLTITDPSNATDTSVYGINNLGQIVGSDGAGAFVASPAGPTVSSIWAQTPTGQPQLVTGATATIAVQLNEAVTVNKGQGDPALQLNDNEVASYQSGSGTNTLIFSYTVQPSDSTFNLQVTALDLPSGSSITDQNGNVLSIVTGDLGLTVNANALLAPAPTVSSITAVADNDATTINGGHVAFVTMTTSAPVTVTGVPTLQLNDNEVAYYTGGSGTNALSFIYVVQPADNVADLQVTGLNLPSGASITDSNGNSLSGAVTSDLGLTIEGKLSPATVAQEINGLYLTLYGIAATAAGITYWENVLSSFDPSVTTANAASTAISLNDQVYLGEQMTAGSPMVNGTTYFATLYESTTDMGFVQALYQNMSNFIGTVAGDDYWYQLLQQAEDVNGGNVIAARESIAGQFVHDFMSNDLTVGAAALNVSQSDYALLVTGQQALLNRAAVSQYYVNEISQPGGSILNFTSVTSPAFAAAQNVLASITSDPSTVAVAITGINNAVAHQDLSLI